MSLRSLLSIGAAAALLFGAVAATAPAATAGQALDPYQVDRDTGMPLVVRPWLRPTPSQPTQPSYSAIPREIVAAPGNYPAGTIVVSHAERRLYFMLGGGRAVRYGVGVGRPGFEWQGSYNVSRKAEWPNWVPPPQMLRRRPDLPRFMAGGPANPLGARAMYLGSSFFRIHGSNEPHTIGQAVSSGCIRMTNEDVVDLYDRVRIGTRVVMMRDIPGSARAESPRTTSVATLTSRN